MPHLGLLSLVSANPGATTSPCASRGSFTWKLTSELSKREVPLAVGHRGKGLCEGPSSKRPILPTCHDAPTLASGCLPFAKSLKLPALLFPQITLYATSLESQPSAQRPPPLKASTQAHHGLEGQCYRSWTHISPHVLGSVSLENLGASPGGGVGRWAAVWVELGDW